MALEQDTKQKIFTLCKGEKYEEAADLIVGDTKEEETYAEVVDALRKVGTSINGGVISNIYRIYMESGDNVPVLQEKFGNLVSGHAVHKASSAAPDKPRNGEIDVDQVRSEDLDSTIASLRKKQNALIRAGSKPDPLVARQLTTLIDRKQELADADYGAEFKAKATVDTSTPQEGSDQWFVLPDTAELDKYEVVKVVTGSPMIAVLRDRYEQDYKINIRDDFRDGTKSLTPEGEFEKKKAIDKERTFVDGYKDTDTIEDQDIYVSQVASKFITDQYDIVEPRVDAADKNKKFYNFAKGRLVVTYNRETKTHNVSIEGEIPGSVTISIKRRTDSGRIIDDAYDIVEFRDSRTVLYAKSSKGNVALRNEDEIRRALSQADIDLAIPPSAVVGEGIVAGEKPRVETAPVPPPKEPKKGSKATAGKAAGEGGVEPDLTPPEAEDKPKEELVPPKPASQPEEEKPQLQRGEELVEPKSEQNSITPPADPTVPVENEEKFKAASKGDAGHLRSQLIAANAKETSETTKNYLAAQIAKAEGKSLEAVKREFGLSVSAEDKIEEAAGAGKLESGEEIAPTEESLPGDEDLQAVEEEISEDGDIVSVEEEVEGAGVGGASKGEEKAIGKADAGGGLEVAAEIAALKRETNAAEKMASKAMETVEDTLEVVSDLTHVVEDIQKMQLQNSKSAMQKGGAKEKAPTKSLKNTLDVLLERKKKKTDPKTFSHPEEMAVIKKRLSKPKGGNPDDPTPVTGQSKRSNQ